MLLSFKNFSISWTSNNGVFFLIPFIIPFSVDISLNKILFLQAFLIIVSFNIFLFSSSWHILSDMSTSSPAELDKKALHFISFILITPSKLTLTFYFSNIFIHLAKNLR